MKQKKERREESKRDVEKKGKKKLARKKVAQEESKAILSLSIRSNINSKEKAYVEKKET
jgi:hypothetical protein